MEKGPWIAPSSSWVTKEGWAAKPTSILPVFKKRTTYYRTERVSKSYPNIAVYINRIIETYLRTEAVTHSTDLLHAQSLTDILDGSLHDGVDVGRLVLGQPGAQVDLAGIHVGSADLVTLEQVRDDRQVAALGELIGEELGVGEDAEDVGQEDDGLLRGLVVLGVGDVGVD